MTESPTSTSNDSEDSVGPRLFVPLDKLIYYVQNRLQVELVIRYMFPKIVQRSYGKEKRFFCPPAQFLLVGEQWNANLEEHTVRIQSQMATYALTNPNERIQILEPLQRIYHFGINDNNPPQAVGAFDKVCTGKSLYINNSDTRKYFNINVDLMLKSGSALIIQFSRFLSTEIKVVSKPPKKQSLRSNEATFVCLKSGMKISVYNRSRAQPAATRYLHVDNEAVRVSHETWSCFMIYALDPNDLDQQEQFDVLEGYIYYGSVVRIVEQTTGLILPNMFVRRIDTEGIHVTSGVTDEPVAQLQRIAFEFCDDPGHYLAFQGDRTIQREVNQVHPGLFDVHDTVCWTVANTEILEYHYFEARGPIIGSMDPMPRVTSANLEASSEQNAIVELIGENFTSDCQVVFGFCPTSTESLCSKSMRVKVPCIRDIFSMPYAMRLFAMRGNVLDVPIFIVRKDGAVFNIFTTFAYAAQTAGGLGTITVSDPWGNVKEVK